MVKQSGLGDNFYYAGYDLSGNIASVDKISGGPALLEATTIKQSAHSRIFGLRDGSLSFTTLFENAGTVATPGMPASGTPVTSAYNFSVLVTVTGGTVTNVVINGSSVGTGPGTYVLPAFGVITLTYSAAPTWTWIAIGTEHNVLKNLPVSDQVLSYFRGTAVGSASACINSKQTNYDPTRGTDGSLTLKVDVMANGFGLEWGLQLTPGLRADTAPTNGASRDDTAGTAFGMQAYCQITELVGTNVDIAIQHSTDNATWATIIDFGSQTAIGALRGAVSNTTAINRYLRAITTGTFTYVQFCVATCRNPVAGVVF